MGGARISGVERPCPVRGTQRQLSHIRLHDEGFFRWLLVQPYRGLDRPDHVSQRLQPCHLRVGLDGRGGSLWVQLPQCADLHALLAEARQHIGHVVQIRLMRTHEQQAAAAVAQAGIGVQQIRRAVQGHDGLAGAGAAIDHECTS